MENPANIFVDDSQPRPILVCTDANPDVDAISYRGRGRDDDSASTEVDDGDGAAAQVASTSGWGCYFTNEGLQQGYCVIPSAKRFILLYSFLRNLSKGVIVFFSSCNSVKFHSELLRCIQVDCVCIHGKQKEQKRTTTFFDFCKAEKGVLLCTDVAARGLDIPDVDWIVQYDPPDEPKEYVHRVGRTARGEGAKGNALLVLQKYP